MEVNVKLIAILLVSAGAVFLLSSFVHRKHLCNSSSKQQNGWQLLFILNVFFLIGYLVFLIELFSTEMITVYHLVVTTIFFGGGLFVNMVMRMSAATVMQIKQIAEQDRHNAFHDALTGLPNRTLLYERIQMAVAGSERDEKPLAIILLDLDHFKEVNDTLGHAVGDQLLQQLAPRIKQCVREVDTLARLGGDEFAAVLPTAGERDAILIAEKLRDAIELPINVNNQLISVGVSMGIAICPQHGKDAENLLQHADIAMYQAKHHAKDYMVYNGHDKQFSLNRLELVSNLREAVKRKDFYLVYQPKLNLQNGEITSVEALIRWKNAEHKNVSPEIFIPIIEHLGLMQELTLWVIQQSLLQVRKWRQHGLNITVAVNVSVKNLIDAQFPQSVKSIVEQSNSSANNLMMEITESSMMANPALAMSILKDLANMGIGLSIDDYGKGYSSLVYLKNLPVMEVKIDRSFVKGVIDNDNDAVIVCATIGMVHSLDYKIVAEGVETKEVLDFVRHWGCDVAQGFHISQPLGEHELFDFVMKHNESILMLSAQVAPQKHNRIQPTG